MNPHEYDDWTLLDAVKDFARWLWAVVKTGTDRASDE